MSLEKDFEGYNLRCRVCGFGKPSEEYKHSYNRVCLECRGGSNEV